MAKTILDIQILRRWIKAAYSRSPKPGGQNVNKVNTRVTLLFDFDACDQLSETHKQRIRRRLSTRLARDGRLQIVRHRHRTQLQNRQDAEEQLVQLLRCVLVDERVRKATKPTVASKKRRIDNKRRQGQLKKQRRISAEE